MSQWYEDMKKHCTCPNKHYPLTIETIAIRNGASQELRSYLHEKKYRHVLLVYDDNTKEAGGEELKELLNENGFEVNASLILPDAQGDVIADEASLIQVMADADERVDVLIAVGAGTIHDITRFVSYKMGRPFVSFPTAPSVDGFTSMGAPVVLRKKKITFQTQAPVALFAEPDILRRAPGLMIAAGFGDMLGKYTSLADWKFGSLTAGEPYCRAAADMTEEALGSCMAHAADIAKRSDKGIHYLMTALVKSGLAMSLFGHSHPASGGEHHLSHFWEMSFLEGNRKQLLHGEKVGVSAALIADYYKSELPRRMKADPKIDRVAVGHILTGIPDGDVLRGYLSKVGGKTKLNELGIEHQLYDDSLKQAHKIRSRSTMLKYLTGS